MISASTNTRLMSLSIFMVGVLVRSLLPKIPKFIFNRNKSQIISISSHIHVEHDHQMSSSQQRNIDDIHLKAQADAYKLYQKLRSYNDPTLAPAVHASLDVLADALRLYGPTRLISSFNGGKDAVVVMHLLRAAMAKYSYDQHHMLSKNGSNMSSSHYSIIRPTFIYFAIKYEFPEVLSYIHDMEAQYDLHLITYDCGIIQGLEQYVNQLSHGQHGSHSTCTHVAFILGTRQGDHNAIGQEIFCPSSSWMPVPFMRVNPILRWSYGQVWQFLRVFDLPYCSLYDDGYTSLGKTTDTQPNPYLLRKAAGHHDGDKYDDDNRYDGGNGHDDDKRGRYWPAHLLADWSQERAGRVDTTKESLAPTPASSTKYQPSSSSSKLAANTAGMIVIGDEILDGSILESNMQVAAKLFRSSGIVLKKVSIISDDVDDIIKEVRLFSQLYDIVITSGGVGPTHDDVTIKAVAASFDVTLEVHKKLLAYLKHSSSSSQHDDDHLMRFATLPSNTRLRFPPPLLSSSSSSWPIIQCENVFVLPGIPKYFAMMMPTIINLYLLPTSLPTITRSIALSVEEKTILMMLDDAVMMHPEVKIGSYPYVDRSDYKTILKLSSCDEMLLAKAYDHLMRSLPADTIVSMDNNNHNHDHDGQR